MSYSDIVSYNTLPQARVLSAKLCLGARSGSAAFFGYQLGFSSAALLTGYTDCETALAAVGATSLGLPLVSIRL